MKGRWLRGWPEVLMRVHGNWIELTGTLPIPANLGTPGLSNSRFVANPGPAIYQVQHSPPLPAAGQPVVVTARFHDPDGVTPTLKYRLDPSGTYISAPMNDTGVNGDAVAGDGVYSATIPGQPARVVAAFVVTAQDSLGQKTVFPADLGDNSQVVRECVVMFGDTVPTASFGHYHLWLTQNWINRWAKLQALSNENHDGTLVDGGGRIIYNMTGRFAGSPYHQYSGSPVTTLGGMHWNMPDDDKFLGSTSFNKQHVPGNGPLDDNTLQREQTSYWMARRIGLPWNYRRYYFLYVNGNRHGPMMEDSQTPGADVINENFPADNNGWLYKNNAWFEFDPGGTSNDGNYSWCTLNKYTTTIGGVPNQHKLARYRWNYWVRQFPDSVNNYSNVFAKIDAFNSTNSASYASDLDAIVDTEEYLRIFAVEHATGDMDSFGNQNEWNMYSYKPVKGRWTLFKWDWNITLGSGGASQPSDGSMLFNWNHQVQPGVPAGNQPMGFFQAYPPFRRAYLRAFKEIADVAMNNTYADPILDAKYAAFAANGLTGSPYNAAEPGVAGLKNWIGAMHRSLVNVLNAQGVANVPFAINGPQNPTTGGNSITLTGTAPIEVKTITINGVAYPLIWPDLKSWTVQVPLSRATNILTIQGVDRLGNPLTNSLASITVQVTNSPPDLALIANQSAPQGSLLKFTATATDAGSPPQTLTFSLDVGAPSGASIDPVRGVFTWIPPFSATVTTNSIVVRVTDDGIPPMTDAKSFVVIAIPDTTPITILGIQADSGQATLTWTSEPGRSYRLQYTTDLGSVSWMDVPGDVTGGAGTSASKTDAPLSTGEGRFYRVLRVP
jgi:hypothetical protein